MKDAYYFPHDSNARKVIQCTKCGHVSDHKRDRLGFIQIWTCEVCERRDRIREIINKSFENINGIL